MPLTRPAERPAGAGSNGPPCQVLLVVGDPQRHALLQRCVQTHLPGCRIDVADSYLDAMDRASRLETHLLVLDLAMDSVLVPALRRFLARAAPQAMVHVFDDSQDSAPGAGTGCNRPSIVRLKRSFSAMALAHVVHLAPLAPPAPLVPLAPLDPSSTH